VYSFIELVAEVSGLADIFNISAAFFLAFYNLRVQKAEVVEEMTSLRSRKRPELHGNSKETDFLAEHFIRFRLKSNLWLTLTAGLCPKAWRRTREVNLLKL
jgi:hypothetical protein